MTKQLPSGQGGGIERWGGTVNRGPVRKMMHVDNRAQLMSPSQLESLRPVEVHESVRATWIRGRGDLEMGSLSIRRGRWDIRIAEAVRRAILP